MAPASTDRVDFPMNAHWDSLEEAAAAAVSADRRMFSEKAKAGTSGAATNSTAVNNSSNGRESISSGKPGGWPKPFLNSRPTKPHKAQETQDAELEAVNDTEEEAPKKLSEQTAKRASKLAQTSDDSDGSMVDELSLLSRANKEARRIDKKLKRQKEIADDQRSKVLDRVTSEKDGWTRQTGSKTFFNHRPQNTEETPDGTPRSQTIVSNTDSPASTNTAPFMMRGRGSASYSMPSSAFGTVSKKVHHQTYRSNRAEEQAPTKLQDHRRPVRELSINGGVEGLAQPTKSAPAAETDADWDMVNRVEEEEWVAVDVDETSARLSFWRAW